MKKLKKKETDLSAIYFSLRDLVELGPRVFGYESNEVEAVRVVRAAIEEISKNSKKVVEVNDDSTTYMYSMQEHLATFS